MPLILLHFPYIVYYSAFSFTVHLFMFPLPSGSSTVHTSGGGGGVIFKSEHGDFFKIFYILYSSLLHLRPLKFHCVGGCWDRTQDCCDFGIGSIFNLSNKYICSQKLARKYAQKIAIDIELHYCTAACRDCCYKYEKHPIGTKIHGGTVSFV